MANCPDFVTEINKLRIMGCMCDARHTNLKLKENVMKVYEVDVGQGLNRCTEKDIKILSVWFEEASIGETITIRIKEMSEEEYGSLPEFMDP